nr:immunoglobulin heavy chain junction region [Mus musculus]
YFCAREYSNYAMD